MVEKTKFDSLSDAELLEIYPESQFQSFEDIGPQEPMPMELNTIELSWENPHDHFGCSYTSFVCAVYRSTTGWVYPPHEH